MRTRRGFLKSGAAAAAVPFAASAAPVSGVYSRLGVKPVINGVGTVTVLGGSIMPPEVLQAMEEASRHFVSLPELQKKAGQHIANLVHVPAAMITAGAASSITVAAAACLARGDAKRLAQLPDTSGLPNEIVQQKTHRSGYEAQMLLTGAKIVWVETRAELDAAINSRTAMMFFLNKADPDGKIQRAEWLRVAKARGVPAFNDAAADVPPAGRLGEYVQEGFDLVAFSGGKGLLGPQASGLLLGRKDLVEAGMLAISPHGGIGRGMKVGKEEIAGLVAAIERYLKVDHAAERRVMEGRAAHVIQTLGAVPGVKASPHMPQIANQVPHVRIEWTEGAGKPSARDVVAKLMEGDQPVSVSHSGAGSLTVSMWTLRGEEHRIVARRIRELLT